MKRKIIAVLIAILGVIFVCAVLLGGPLAAKGPARIVYSYDYCEVQLDEVLTDEETAAFAKIVAWKPWHTTLIGMPSCGFDTSIAIEYGGIRYLIACDTCGTLFDRRLARYMDLSNDEIAVIHEMFEKRGAKFPCT